MFDKSQAGSIIGQQLRTSDGGKIGKIGQVYLDDYHDQPEWITVNTGMFGTNESFVPLAEATLDDDGGVTVPYTKDKIQDAPNIEDSGHLSEAQEQDLYTYYDIPFTTEGSTFPDTSKLGQTTTQTTAGTAAGTAVGAADEESVGDVDPRLASTGGGARGSEDVHDYSQDTAGAGAATGRDASVGVTDEAMTRSEERLNVGTEQVEPGRARLRKWVETENVQVEVPVRTEKAVLVSEPITGENRGDALDGPDISEEEHVVTLNAERPVVSKETVPVERVRVDKQVEESVQTVQDEVRKEQIALEDETTDARTGGADSDDPKHRR